MLISGLVTRRSSSDNVASWLQKPGLVAGQLCPWNKKGPVPPGEDPRGFRVERCARGMADGEEEIRRALKDVQSMIDVCAERLEGLRTQCSTSAELTQQEIRTLEVTRASADPRKSGPDCRPIIVIAIPLPALSVDVSRRVDCQQIVNTTCTLSFIPGEFLDDLFQRIRENLISPHRALWYAISSFSDCSSAIFAIYNWEIWNLWCRFIVISCLYHNFFFYREIDNIILGIRLKFFWVII